MTKHGLTIQERFDMKVAPKNANGCMEWTAAKQQDGYGVMGWDGKQWPAHRLAYWLAFGPFDLKLHVLHTCDNPPCVNPEHLWLGTNSDNMKDKARKGRALSTRIFTEEEIEDIKGLKSLGISSRQIAHLYDVDPKTIRSWT